MTPGHLNPPVYRVLFHIRHFGVGGIENALIGWLRALDRRRFSIGVCVSLPTRELETIFRERIPHDVALHFVIPSEHWLSELHQKRRDGVLGTAGRAALGLGMVTLGRSRMRTGVARYAQAYDAVIDFDLTLRKLARSIENPLIGVRHFGLWAKRTAKAVRVGREYRHYDCLVVLNEAMQEQARALYGGQLPRVEV